MNEFIKFTVNKEPYISVGWQMGTTCNYTCSYCLVRYSNYVEKKFPEDYKAFMGFIKKIMNKYPNKKILISLFGGEPTLWKHFHSFIQETKKYDNIMLRVVTNGSKSVEWWKKIINDIHHLIISYHTEYSDPKHLIDVISLASQNKKIQSQINYMLKPENFFENVKIAKKISEEAKCFILLKLLRKQLSPELFDYTQEQLDYLENNRVIGQQYFNHNLEYRLFSTRKDNTIKEHKNINEILIHKYNRWKGWECTAGIDAFTVDYNQNIYVCNQTEQKNGKIGNINKGYELPDKPFICEMEVCTCLQDILDCNKRKI